jgi:hypothetical protein
MQFYRRWGELIMDSKLDERTQIRVDSCRKIWKDQQRYISLSDLDEIGRRYLRHILKLDDAGIERFLEWDPDTYHAVGMKQSGMPEEQGAVEAYWSSIFEMFPEAYTREQKEFLKEEGGLGGVLDMMFTVAPPGITGTGVMGEIYTNSHVYK